MKKNNSKETHYGKGDNDTRTKPSVYKANFDNVDFSKAISTKGFTMRVNGKEVK
jgi:hypothetical protein